MTGENFKPKILIFAAEMAYRGIDAAGLMKAEYPATTYVIRIPCASMLRPDLILYAFKKGFDGVFVASSGEDCPFLTDCVERTAERIEKAYDLLQENGIERERLKLAGICSVCVEAFVKHVNSLYETLKKLGPIKKG